MSEVVELGHDMTRDLSKGNLFVQVQLRVLENTQAEEIWKDYPFDHKLEQVVVHMILKNISWQIIVLVLWTILRDSA